MHLENGKSIDEINVRYQTIEYRKKNTGQTNPKNSINSSNIYYFLKNYYTILYSISIDALLKKNLKC